MNGGRDEDGFTLVELLVVIAIIGIVSYALTESIIIGLRTTTATEQQVSGSLDRQRLAQFFVPDAQSAQTVDEVPPCGAGTTTPIVTLSRADRGVVKTASYWVEDGALRRRYCEEGTLRTDKVVAENLVTAVTNTRASRSAAPSSA